MSHDTYCDRKGFTFPLISDPDRKVTEAYEALKLSGRLVRRTVYVIGPDGVIIFAEKGMPANERLLAAISAHRA